MFNFCFLLFSGLFTNAVQLNNDNRVANFISNWLPLNHKPDLIDNTVYVMADLYNIIDLVSTYFNHEKFLYFFCVIFEQW